MFGRAVGLALALLLAGAPATATAETLGARDARLVDAAIAALAPQRPGVPELFVVGVAGDGAESVFRNEVDYLDTLMSRRFGAAGHVVSLVNHADSFARDRPLATLENLRRTLAGVASVMDPDEDLLLLFLTSHGTRNHRLYLHLPPVFEALLSPRQLRAALDDAGIRHRVVVVSACYSGGFVPALASADTLVLTAARRNRPSFGCGVDSTATFFGRAWMIEALNLDTDFVAAFAAARQRIAEREKSEAFPPSDPQLAAGASILPRLRQWQATLPPAAPVPYPYPDHPDDPAGPARAAAAGAGGTR